VSLTAAPIIETARLVLRLPIGADFEGWAALMVDAEASKFIGGPQHRAAAWRGFIGMAGAWQNCHRHWLE
jgi:RimJ/RimL family protein N-acetyltransferase